MYTSGMFIIKNGEQDFDKAFDFCLGGGGQKGKTGLLEVPVNYLYQATIAWYK